MKKSSHKSQEILLDFASFQDFTQKIALTSLNNEDMQKNFGGIKSLFFVTLYNGAVKNVISPKTGQKNGQNWYLHKM